MINDLIRHYGITITRTIRSKQPMKKTARISFFLLLFGILLKTYPDLNACTALYVKTHERILVGNNEDGCNPETRIWFVPGEKDTYGRMYFGFSDLSAQGGINEKGLWFDAFGLPFKAVQGTHGEIYPGDLQDRLMAGCASVNDVLNMLKQYNRSGMTRYQLMFGDSEGNSVIIEGDTVLRMQGNYQVITNFRQSEYPSGKGFECNRYQIANEMLKSHPDPDLNSVRNILSATHSEGEDVTLYSYIADLSSGIVNVYHFHNFENAIAFNLREELAKGRHILDLSGLFPRTHAAESFYYKARTDLQLLKARKFDKTFNAVTYPEYFGNYIITSPDILANQLISIRQGTDCLHLHLNNGGPYEVIPVSSSAFVLLSYGGLEFNCTFTRNPDNRVNTLHMEGSGLSIIARKTE
jgi:hypothetical protein